MKEKRNVFVSIYGVLKELENEKASVRFSFAVAKNLKILENEVQPIYSTIQKPVEGSEEYEKERKVVIERFCEKDKNGKPKMEGNGQYKIPQENINGLNYELEQLGGKYPDVMKRIQEKEKEIKKLLDEEVDLELRKIHLKDLPEKLSPAQMNILMPIIEE